MYKQGTISHLAYKQYRNHFTSLIRIAKRNYYNQIFSSFRNNTKIIWKTINELKGKKRIRTNITTLNHNDLIAGVYILHTMARGGGIKMKI